MQRLDFFYGPPFSAKSTAIAALIARFFNETGKKFRVLVGDGSAVTYQEAGLVDAGAVDLYEYGAHHFPSTTTEQLAQGYWPVDAFDPNSKLEPTPRDEQLKLAGTIIEGTSVMGEYLMSSVPGGFADQQARGIKIGSQDGNTTWKDQDIDAKGFYKAGTGTGRVFGGNHGGHYGAAQGHMKHVLNLTKSLPGWKIWTGHERLAEDDGEKVIGPEVAGKALTTRVVRQFSSVLHFTKATKVTRDDDKHTGAKVKDAEIDYRIYTVDHYDPDGLVPQKYLAGVRTMKPELIPVFLSGKPGEAINRLFSLLAQAKKEYETETLKKSA